MTQPRIQITDPSPCLYPQKFSKVYI